MKFNIVMRKHTYKKKTHNPSSAAIKAINQPWPEAKKESCSDGYICYIPGSICLAALDNAASLVCKHIVPITPIQLAKHEMTVKAVWGGLLFADTARQQQSESIVTHK